MSYARFGLDSSDVYVYASAFGYHCCGCGSDQSDFSCETPGEMLTHLAMHKDRGDKVPNYALDRLSREIHEEALAEEKPEGSD